MKVFHRALALIGSVFVLFASNSLLASEPLVAGNPIAATLSPTDFSLQVEDVIKIPNSADGSEPFARLEQLGFSGDGSGELFVIDQRGKMYRFREGDSEASVYFDFSTNAPNFRSERLSQSGLRSFSFHPNAFAPGSDGFGKLYIAYETDRENDSESHRSVVAEWTLNESGAIDPSSRRELLIQSQPRSDHNVGKLGFNPNAQPGDSDFGLLYISFGDGGQYKASLGDTELNPNAQILTNFLGSILRINPLPSGELPYSIPSDNPFVNAEESVKKEIWAYGLRNPHQFSWDTGGDGNMLIADIGEDNIEEINIGVPGANYGWPVREGTFLTNPNLTSGLMSVSSLDSTHLEDGYTYPVAQYDHDIENDNDGTYHNGAIAGGCVYRGLRVPELEGRYIFANFGSDNEGPIYVVGADELILRNDFTSMTNGAGFPNGGFLAPVQKLVLLDAANNQAVTLNELVQRARIAEGVSRGTSRTDVRFGIGPDGEVYIMTKRDGWIRRFKSIALPSSEATIRGRLQLEEEISGVITLNFSGEPEREYQLQGVESISSSDWSILTDFTTDSFGEYVISLDTDEPRLFYRTATEDEP